MSGSGPEDNRAWEILMSYVVNLRVRRMFVGTCDSHCMACCCLLSHAHHVVSCPRHFSECSEALCWAFGMLVFIVILGPALLLIQE